MISSWELPNTGQRRQEAWFLALIAGQSAWMSARQLPSSGGPSQSPTMLRSPGADLARAARPRNRAPTGSAARRRAASHVADVAGRPPHPARDVAFRRTCPFTRAIRHHVFEVTDCHWCVGFVVPVRQGRKRAVAADVHADHDRHAARSERPLPHVLHRVHAAMDSVTSSALAHPLVFRLHAVMISDGYDTHRGAAASRLPVGAMNQRAESPTHPTRTSSPLYPSRRVPSLTCRPSRLRDCSAWTTRHADDVEFPRPRQSLMAATNAPSKPVIAAISFHV